MNCAECKELLVGYVEGFLDQSQKRAVAEHLRECPSCRGQVQQIEGLHERLVTNGKALAGSNLENEVMNRIIRQQKIQLEAQGGLSKAPNIWRIIMKSKITKLAVAAAIVIAALIGLHSIGNPFEATVTFAQVIEPILNSRTIIFDFFIGDEETGPVMHDIVVDQRIKRTISNLPGMTHIIDLDSSQILVLNDEEQSAAYIDIQGQLQERTQNFVKFLRQVITKLQDNYEELGEQQIDGRKAVGFEASGPNEGLKIWADPETALPIRIELRSGQIFAILKNFQFDAPIDDSLISMDVPSGYTLKQTDFDLGNANEQDFIESLRIWAEVILDGTFPEAIGTESAMKQMPLLTEKIGQMNIPEDEASQMGMSFAKGMLFHQILETQGRWQYTGGGVRLGNADKVIFRYQPDGSETWRVIYGDLHVEEVTPENLPRK
jgi:hypothetical protein